MGDRVWCDKCCLWIQTLTNGRRCLMWRVFCLWIDTDQWETVSDVTSVVCEYRHWHWPMGDRVWCDECCLWIQTLTNGRPCLMWRVLSVNTDTDQWRLCLMWRVFCLWIDTECVVCEYRHWPMGDRVWCAECFVCSASSPCYPDQFVCHSGQCVEEGLVCNFHWDCTDGTDEVNCPSKWRSRPLAVLTTVLSSVSYCKAYCLLSCLPLQAYFSVLWLHPKACPTLINARNRGRS